MERGLSGNTIMLQFLPVYWISRGFSSVRLEPPYNVIFFGI